MNRIVIAAVVMIGLGLACASEAGVITSIQRIDTGDVTPGFTETLILQGLTAGAQVYSDTTFTYGGLPSYLQGADYIKMVNGDQGDSNYRLQLNLNTMATIYLLIDDRVGESSWVKALGFADTGDNVLIADVSSSIYRGTFSSSQIVLQDQFVIEGPPNHMYTVAAAQPTGDIVLTQSATTGTATINTLTLQATNNVVDLTQNSGTTLTLTQGAITKNGTFGSTISGGLLATPATGGYSVAANGGLLTIASALTGPSNKLTVTGAGTLELASIDPAHNFGGGVFINSGTLRISDVRNLGGTAANPNPLNLNAGVLETSGGALTLSNLVNVNFGGATLRPINAASLVTLPNNNQIQGFGAFAKDGAGALVIAGSNAFQGPVTVSGGMLELQNPGALGGTSSFKSPITLNNGTTLNLHSDMAALNFNSAITLSGLGAINVGRINQSIGGDYFLTSLSLPANPNGTPTTLMVTNSSADNSALHFSSQVNLGNDLIVNTSAAVAYFEAALQGTGGLTKTGSGTLFLTGAPNNSFPITTVLQGTLALAKPAGSVAIPTDTFINGGTVRLDSSDQIADAVNVSLTQGMFNLNGRQDTITSLTIAGGTTVTGAGRLVITPPGPGGAALPAGPVGAAPLPGLFISGGVTTINPGGEINATTAQISGGLNTVQAAGGLFTVGSGGLTLAGDLSPNVTFFADPGNPGRLSLLGNVNYTGTLGTASLDTSGVGALAGRIDLNGVERTFTVSDGAGAVDLRISASIVNGALKKSGAGTLRLSGANTYAGGTTISAGALELGSATALGAGPLTLNAGQLSIRADAPPTFANPLTFGGDATLSVDRDTVAGGTTGVVQFTGGLSIGASQLVLTGANRSIRFMGTTTLTGGATFNNVLAVDVAFSNAMTQSGGTWGITKVGAGKVTFDGGAANLYTGITRVNAGSIELNKTPGVNAIPATLNIFGGSVKLLADHQIADAAAVSAANAGSLIDFAGHSDTIGAMSITGNASATVGATGTPALPGSAVLRVTSLTITTGGKVDLANNRLLVDYSGGTPITSIRGMILTGYAGGAWNGPGLSSSSAAGSPRALGYAEATDVLPFANGATSDTFLGSTVDKTTILTRYTLAGDATMDGVVDFNDLVKLAQNYNITDGSRTWIGGDFNYDGNTDFNDLVKLAQNYNSSLPSEAIPGAPADFSQEFARALSQVPEPNALALIGVAAASLLNRRRR